MRTATLAAMMMAASGTAAYAGHSPKPLVTACTAMEYDVEFSQAKTETSLMFSRIGVDLEWHSATHCPAGAIKISLSKDTPSDLKPGALAYALPYEGTHIVVFADRVYSNLATSHAILMGHVLAHEITHILEGCSRHSTAGLMKAYWNHGDFRQMKMGGMTFASEDIALIQAGLASREKSLAASTKMAQDHTTEVSQVLR
jgi:hypothetical protein